MNKLILLFIFLVSFASAQTKKPQPAAKNGKPAKADTAIAVTPVKEEKEMTRNPHEFAVYSRRPKGKERMKLCLNLVYRDTNLTYCINDSLTKDPETSKVMFEKVDGDTAYVLVYVEAFSKPDDKPSCDAGKEIKLFFARWNTKTGKATWKQRTVSSCMRGVTNMTKDPIGDWDRSSVLNISYYKGASDFVDIKFDPAEYKKGFQPGSGSSSSETKSE